MMPFNIIAAIDSRGGVGKDGGLPWRLPEDLRHFKKITSRTQSSGKVNLIVMGRKTWDSIPLKFRPLPGRINLVLSRNAALDLPKNVLRAGNLDQIPEIIKERGLAAQIEQVYIIGGGQIFQETLRHPQLKKLYITHIQQDLNCDTFFPLFKDFFLEKSASDSKKYDRFTYYFAEYQPKSQP